MADKIEKSDLPGVESVTEETPHPADEDSSPGPYNDLSPDRPPVSTSKPDVPIAQSLVGGAGAPSPDAEVDYSPEAQAEEASAPASKAKKEE